MLCISYNILGCRVLGDLLNCEKETMSSYDDEELKNSLHLGTLSLLATTWQHYGHRSDTSPSPPPHSPSSLPILPFCFCCGRETVACSLQHLLDHFNWLDLMLDKITLLVCVCVCMCMCVCV